MLTSDTVQVVDVLNDELKLMSVVVDLVVDEFLWYPWGFEGVDLLCDIVLLLLLNCCLVSATRYFPWKILDCWDLVVTQASKVK
jgi:hypothetical protein